MLTQEVMIPLVWSF